MKISDIKWVSRETGFLMERISMKKVLFTALFALFALVSASSFATQEKKAGDQVTGEPLPLVEGDGTTEGEGEGKEKK
jgi:hypothetical protein